MESRITPEILRQLEVFVQDTGRLWADAGHVKNNSFGVQLLWAPFPGSNFSEVETWETGFDAANAKHDSRWYILNATSKNVACRHTGLDSHEAVRLWQGTLRFVEGVFPWGGAIIDNHYGLIIGVSGFKEDEDILFARTIRNFLVMLLDREGQAWLQDARDRGDREGVAGADRFTRRFDLQQAMEGYGEVDEPDMFPGHSPLTS